MENDAERTYAIAGGWQAANALVEKGALGQVQTQHAVIPIRADEPQVVMGRALNKTLQDVLNPFGLASPWVR
jgi:hypothetical protein